MQRKHSLLVISVFLTVADLFGGSYTDA